MMSDRNDLPRPIGRRGAERGGYPSGAVTLETFDWWRERVESNEDSVIVSAHHHMLKETTVASGPVGGLPAGRQKGAGSPTTTATSPTEAPEGASYLYFVGDEPDAQAFEGYMRENPGSADLWIGGHTHANPDDRKGGRSHVERKWGCNFVNAAALSRYHGRTNVPMSRLLDVRGREARTYGSSATCTRRSTRRRAGTRRPSGRSGSTVRSGCDPTGREALDRGY